MTCRHNEETIDLQTPDYEPASIYDIVFKDQWGRNVHMSDFKEKVILIVNVASASAFASQTYHELNILYEKYHEDGLEIFAFPCNQFAGQEPDRDDWIHETMCTRFHAKFLDHRQVDVNGPNTHTLYRFLKDKRSNGERIRWNFTKFLVNRTGGIQERYPPHIPPYKLEEDILSLLAVELPRFESTQEYKDAGAK